MFKRRDWNYLYGEGVRSKNGDSSDSDDSIESAEGFIERDVDGTSSESIDRFDDDEAAETKQEEESEEERKKAIEREIRRKLKESKRKFTALKCSVCEGALILSEHAKGSHLKSSRHLKRVEKLSDDDARKTSGGNSCFVNASKFKKVEVEEETETHSERLARIRMKRKIREEEEEEDNEKIKARKEPNAAEKSLETTKTKTVKKKIGRRQLQSKRQKVLVGNNNKNDDDNDRNNKKDKDGVTKKTIIKSYIKMAAVIDDEKQQEQQKKKGKPGKRERMELKQKKIDAALKAKEAGERGVKKALANSSANPKDRRKAIIAKKKKELGIE